VHGPVTEAEQVRGRLRRRLAVVSTIPTSGTPAGIAPSTCVPARSKATTMSAEPRSTDRSTASRTSSGSSDSMTRTPIAKSAARAASSIPWRTDRWPNRVVFDVSTVTLWTGPPASALATRLGR